jgi:probable HAF family extracellular repeat protein
VAHPFLWENGVMRDLGVLAPRPCTYFDNCSWGEATGINASGVVVGTSRDAEGRDRAFIWEKGVMRDLGVAPGHVTTAIAINDRGQVIGSVDDDMFFWDNGQTQIIGPYWSFHPVGLSPNGEVIGSGMGGSPGEHALVWQAGRLIDLGPGVALAINNRGEVVGWTDSRGVVDSYFGSAFARPMLWRRRP